MRYRELSEARPWKRYEGQHFTCCVIACRPNIIAERTTAEITVQIGNVYTGKQNVFAGWFVKLVLPSGEVEIAEDPHVLRCALRMIEANLNAKGWSLNVVGLDPEWRESGLSANTGYGSHPDFSRAVHMLERDSRVSAAE